MKWEVGKQEEWCKMERAEGKPSCLRWELSDLSKGQCVFVCLFGSVCGGVYAKFHHVYIFSFKPVNFALYLFSSGLVSWGTLGAGVRRNLCVFVHRCTHSHDTHSGIVWVMSTDTHILQWQFVWCWLHQVLQGCFPSLSCLSQSAINDGLWRMEKTQQPTNMG